MNQRSFTPALLAFALALALSSGAHAKPAAAPAAPAASIGKTESARWTSTTLEAATSDAHKKVLASGKPTTVTGEVVEVNKPVTDNPALVNTEPYAGGWFYKIKLSNAAELNLLLTPENYQAQIGG